MLAAPDAQRRFGFADGVWVERWEGSWVVRWADSNCRPVAELVARAAPPEVQVLLGLPPGRWDVAVAWVKETHGVDLTTSEVRVGVTRGHLLALVFSVPLDVPGDLELLEAAAESVCERALGELLLDRWIVAIDVVRSARRSKLAVLSTRVETSAQTHPGALLCELVQLGVSAVLGGVPETQLTPASDGWTALELSPGAPGAQGDRLQAFTSVPEALKAALEGLPFDSARFTRGPEVMIWCAWTRGELEARIVGREIAEATIFAMAPGRVAVCGSGFGLTRDFLDLWVLPEVEVLADLRAELARRLGVPVELGFYDTHWSSELLEPWQAALGDAFVE